MGLLDDAIREHLELKRRHGASEEEVQRLAQEALTPPQQAGTYAASPQDPGPATVQGDLPGTASLSSVPADVDEPLLAPPGYSLADHPVMPEPAGHEPLVETGESAPGAAPFGEPADIAAVPSADPRPAEPAADVPPASPFSAADPWLEDDEVAPSGQETTAFSALEAADADDSAGPVVNEDVLEETPDFLQETPEHDRLWFEQRPPRPFDFDQ